MPYNYNQNVQEKQNLIKNIYQGHLCKFETKEGMKDRPVVYVNASELLDFVFEQRNLKLVQEAKIKVIDKTFSKLQFLFYLKMKKNKIFQVSIKKMPFYFSEENIRNKRKLNSVYRLIILCIVPHIKETYDTHKF